MAVSLREDINGNPLPCSVWHENSLFTQLQYMNVLVRGGVDPVTGDKIKGGWDNIGLICGGEGDGKSVEAFTIALTLWHKFCLDQVVYTVEQFNDAIENTEEFGVIVWDEADELGGAWNSKVLVAIKRKMKRIRDKHLHIIWVTPTVFDLNKYFAVHRSRWLLHIYSYDFQRGYYRFFNKDNKRMLYFRGKKEWNWSAYKSKFRGTFRDLPRDFPFSMAAGSDYRAKKASATAEILGEDEGPTSIRQAVSDTKKLCADRFVRWCSSHGVKYNQSDMSFIVDVGTGTMSKWVNAGDVVK